MGDLFGGYGVLAGKRRRGRGGAWDEMFSGFGRSASAEHARAPYRELYSALAALTQEELRGRTDALASSYLAQGVTFDFAGEERPFPLDAVPRVIEQDEWRRVEAGITQRVRALEAFLSDVYGAQNAVRDGVIPAGLITSSAHFQRAAAGIESANGVRIQVSGIDLIRDERGEWRVLEDNVRVPSGVSYVISNRRVMAQTLPELFTSMRVRPVGDYPYRLLQALKASAPDGMESPNVVVLTPGVYNSAYFEHTLLARLMGVELVEGRDLFCSGGKVWMRTTSGPQRVDVIYRRIDDEFIDPLQFRVDSVLGTPGLMLAARLGTVTIANAVGNGVADDKLVYTYLPDLIRYYLAEDALLPNVDTWRLEDPEALAEVLDRLDELVVKPVDGSGGKGLVIGPDASKKELADLRTRLLEDPRGWIAQPVVQLSTIPTLVEEGMRPRHVDLRSFAVNDGRDVWVLPGGLTRVALAEGRLVVNSSQGGGSKDTWVVGMTGSPPEPGAESRRVSTLVADQASASVATYGTQHAPDHSEQDGPRSDQQQQQQQQQQQIVSTEMWECLNTTTARMPRRVTSDKVHEFFNWVRDRAALAVGIMDSGASRDEAWHFFTLGRSLERADMTARLLATRSLTEASGPSWTTILRSCGAYEAYLRTYRVVPSARNAAEFLLHDRLFPRSILFSVARAAESLRDLEPRLERAGVSDQAQRLLGQIQSELEFRPVAEVLDELPAHMSAIQDATSAATEAIRRRYFPENVAPSWIGDAR